MKKENKSFWIAAISGAVGAIVGALSGSRDWLIVGILGAVTAVIVALGIRGWFRN